MILPVNHTTYKPLKIRVRATGSLEGWQFTVSDENRQALLSDFGTLPPGYKFNPATAQLFSEAQAFRAIREHFPHSRIVMVCLARRDRFNGGAIRWAA
jgi:hypothetical protein